MSPRCAVMALYFFIFLPVLICASCRVFKPFGYKMCKSHCDVCESLIFSISSLTCEVCDNRSPDRDASKQGIYLFRTYKDADRRFRGKNVRCYPRMLKSEIHRKRTPYIRWKNTRLCRVDTVKQGEMKRLLIVPIYSGASDLQTKQLRLDHLAVSSYSLTVSHPESVVYISALNQLLMAEPKKRNLYSFDLNTKTMRVRMENVVIKGLAVDELRQLVFMTTESNGLGIVRSMTTNGKDLMSVATLNCTVEGIAVNPEHSTFYVVCFRQKLLFFNGPHVEPEVIDRGDKILDLLGC